MSERTYLQLGAPAQRRLIAAARDESPVRGLTHGYYKYPARFSPIFARAAIETFTSPGDVVLDPHVGGGTTLVEALATGREGIGVDISTLAEFIANVKCTIYSDGELQRLAEWSAKLPSAVDIRKPSTPISDYEERGYYKHLNHRSRWRLRKAIEQSIASAVKLDTPRMEAFARCVVLRTAQWALDGRSKRATLHDFRITLQRSANEMMQGARDLRAAVALSGRTPITILNRSAAGLEEDNRVKDATPKLVVTSPPYPGVHVLYHRWQVDGRKEAPLPFMIANKLDGAGGSYYTMGDRKNPELTTYFSSIRATMASVASIADSETVIVQMVAFADPHRQLPRYLETMEEAGLRELKLPLLKDERDGRLWRSVPGRRWYSEQRGETAASLEVVLFHRKGSPSRLPADKRLRCQTGPTPGES